MANQTVFDVEPRLIDQWAVKIRGKERASAVMFDRKEAIAYANKLAKAAKPSLVVIYSADGKTVEKEVAFAAKEKKKKKK